MNKIVVFGDSFAERQLYIHSYTMIFNSNIDSPPELQEHVTSWMDLIGAQTYGLGGTDIQYSFSEFQKYHNKYDQVIFVLTEPLRLTLPPDIIWTTGHPAKKREKEALERYQETTSQPHLEAYRIWGAVKEIEEVLIPTSQEYVNRQYLFYNLVIERIKQLRPDVKFIKAFSNHDDKFPIVTDEMSSEKKSEILNLLNRTLPSSNRCLSNIQNFENTIMKPKGPYPLLNSDARVAHLTEESHRILAPLIKKWLKTDEMFFDFDIKEFENIKPDVKRYYAFYHKSYEDWLEYYLKDKND